MSASAQIPNDHPLMQAWNAHQATAEYANSRRWAQHDYGVEGSLWALFVAGWMAAQGCGCRPGTCESKTTGCRMAEEVNPGSGAQ